MSGSGARLTCIGGPTALLEYGGLRLLTDPTFDPAGTEYPTPVYTLRKTLGPALDPELVLPVDTPERLGYEGVAEVARRYVEVAVAGDQPPTFTADEAVTAARAFPEAAVARAGLAGRLRWKEL